MKHFPVGQIAQAEWIIAVRVHNISGNTAKAESFA